jgi:hypothetical protein
MSSRCKDMDASLHRYSNSDSLLNSPSPTNVTHCNLGNTNSSTNFIESSSGNSSNGGCCLGVSQKMRKEGKIGAWTIGYFVMLIEHGGRGKTTQEQTSMNKETH